MVMVGWKMYKKETETRGFKKVFKIPDGVILDKIKAKFNEEESVLTISMPKAVKGISGGGVEEVKGEQVEKLPNSSEKKDRKAESSALENQDHGIGTIESTRVVHDQVTQEKGNEIPPPVLVEKDHVAEGNNNTDRIPQVERKMEGEESESKEFSRGMSHGT